MDRMLNSGEIRSEDICVVVNPRAGRGGKRGQAQAQALELAMAALGPGAELRRWSRDGGLEDEVRRALADGHRVIVAAGGDGTVTGVAQAMLGSPAAMAVLPLGTFNYFARGLGLPQEPEAAALAIRKGRVQRISVASVNGQVFLNNASLGLYPAALRAREDVYRRWGRSRIMAHVSLLRTLYRFQRPQVLRLRSDAGEEQVLRTPLLFAARSAYQLGYFGLDGREAISADRFAVYVARNGTRWQLFRMALRLAAGRLEVGRDVELITPHRMEIETRAPRPIVAYDGEKRRMPGPLRFEILEDALNIIVPPAADRVV